MELVPKITGGKSGWGVLRWQKQILLERTIIGVAPVYDGLDFWNFFYINECYQKRDYISIFILCIFSEEYLFSAKKTLMGTVELLVCYILLLAALFYLKAEGRTGFLSNYRKRIVNFFKTQTVFNYAILLD